MTTVLGILNGASSLAGLFSNNLFEKFSMRSVGIFGGIMFFLGNIGNIFCTSIPQLMVTYGLVQGIGLGIMMPVAFAAFNEYFVERRAFVMSIAQVGTGILTMIYPIFVVYLKETFGFRGSIAIIAAVQAHAIFAMLVMHPVKWHYKLVRRPIFEDEPCKLQSVLAAVLLKFDCIIPFFLFLVLEKCCQEIVPDLNGLSVEKLELKTISENSKSRSHQCVIEAISMKNSTEEIVGEIERSKSLDPKQQIDFEKVYGATTTPNICRSDKNAKW